MKLLTKFVLIVLVFLALSSGASKFMLMEQDVEFFGQYGFSNPILIVFGIVQFLGGILLAVPRTRVIGAIVVAVTFLVSLVVLVMSKNFPFAIITLICIGLLVGVVKLSERSKESNADNMKI